MRTQLLGATVQNLVVSATRFLGFANFWFRWIFRFQSLKINVRNPMWRIRPSLRSVPPFSSTFIVFQNDTSHDLLCCGGILCPYLKQALGLLGWGIRLSRCLCHQFICLFLVPQSVDSVKSRSNFTFRTVSSRNTQERKRTPDNAKCRRSVNTRIDTISINDNCFV